MALLVAPILFIAAVLYVAFPLLRESRPSPRALDEKTDWERAFQEKEDLIEALKDIDMDFRMGKLSAEDYRSLKSDFEKRAVQVFQRLELLPEKGVGPSRKKKS